MDASKKKFEVLLVEDNPGDIDRTREGFERAQVQARLSVVMDGEEALAFLRKEDGHGNAPRPDLILLDLDLPRMNGCEVLSEIRTEEKLRCIPVVILSGSNSEQDITRSYRLKANCYVTKPGDFEQLIDVIQSLENFWLTIAKLPPHEDE